MSFLIDGLVFSYDSQLASSLLKNRYVKIGKKSFFSQTLSPGRISPSICALVWALEKISIPQKGCYQVEIYQKQKDNILIATVWQGKFQVLAPSYFIVELADDSGLFIGKLSFKLSRQERIKCGMDQPFTLIKGVRQQHSSMIIDNKNSVRHLESCLKSVIFVGFKIVQRPTLQLNVNGNKLRLDSITKSKTIIWMLTFPLPSQGLLSLSILLNGSAIGSAQVELAALKDQNIRLPIGEEIGYLLINLNLKSKQSKLPELKTNRAKSKYSRDILKSHGDQLFSRAERFKQIKMRYFKQP